MKNRLLIAILSLAYLTASSQTVFYNKGTLTIVSNDTTKMALYINGKMVVATDATDNAITSDILMKNSKVLLTGDFINNVTTGTVFKRPATVSEEGLFEFRSTVAQKITTDGTTYATIPSKATSYIDFPNLKINNNKHVTVTPEIGIQTQDINLSKGWLVLDSRKVVAADYDGLLTAELQNNRTVLPHLLVKGNINYLGWNNTNIEDRGFIEVRLKLDDYKATTAGETKSLFGFGIPFNSLGTDYFMWNHLWSPSNVGFFGDTGQTIVDPLAKLKPGVGYAASIDVRGSDPDNYLIDVNPDFQELGIDFDQRAKDGFYFNRFRFANDPTRSANQLKGTDVADTAYALEKLNNSNIVVDLKPGYNYLSNPFMAPLDITDLLKSNQSASWNVVADNSGNTSRDLLNRVWILKGDASANAGTPVTKATATFNYYLAKEVGGTYTDEYEDLSSSVTIAPLQMFVVYATRNAQITIPKSKRVMSNVKFIRSLQKRIDDFIFEVIDENTGMSDRANIVLRPAKEIQTNAAFGNVAKLSTSTTTDKTKSVEATAVLDQNIFSQIYTIDDAGRPLTVKFISDEAISTPLYLTPAKEARDIMIRGLRLATMENVTNIWLEDRIKATKVELTKDTEYKTTTSPNDPVDRFVLHFRNGTSGIEEGPQNQSKLLAYYDNNTLIVSGFETTDMGSVISLYDMSGKVVLKTTVNETVMNIPQVLTAGAYIVKTTGTRTETIKLLVSR